MIYSVYEEGTDKGRSRPRPHVAPEGSNAYRATPDELRAVEEAECSGIATDDEVEAAFRSFRNS
jgi:hypothetical protein